MVDSSYALSLSFSENEFVKDRSSYLYASIECADTVAYWTGIDLNQFSGEEYIVNEISIGGIEIRQENLKKLSLDSTCVTTFGSYNDGEGSIIYKDITFKKYPTNNYKYGFIEDITD